MMIPRPTVLLLLLACLLVSGAGWYPWLAVAGIVVCIGPLWDWLAVWLLTQDSPLISTVMPLFKWLWLIIALSVGVAFVYVYLVVIRKIRYNRLMGGLE